MFIAKSHHGKVRDSFVLNQGDRVIYTSDRISAFDAVLPFQIPGKGAALQRISNWMFLNSRHIAKNHFIGTLDTQCALYKNVPVIPLEIVVRGRLSGSLWRLYREGGPRAVYQTYNVTLPENLEENDLFTEPILTPTSKAEIGSHDAPLTQNKIINTLEDFIRQHALTCSAGELWEQLQRVSKRLFCYGRELADKADLELIDTKFEFGFSDGLVLIDEVLTPDSSRYVEKHMNGVLLSKEYLRARILEKGSPDSLPLKDLNWWRKEFSLPEIIQNLSSRYEEIARRLVPLTSNELISLTPVDCSLKSETLLDFLEEKKYPSRVLIAGNGAREYSLFKFLQSDPHVHTIYAAPGDRAWGEKYADCNAHSVSDIIQFAKENDVGLIIGGTENFIAAGLADAAQDAGIAVLAPNAECARLESSKEFCKEVACAAGVPSAQSESVTLESLEKRARLWLHSKHRCVIKYDGLAAGKGVFLVTSERELDNALHSIHASLEDWKKLAPFGTNPPIHFLIEDYLDGEEFSGIALCAGEEFRFLPFARDYKRRNNHQTGPNTGGMGTVAPVAISNSDRRQIEVIFGNLCRQMSLRGTPYFGFLFCGFMKDLHGRIYLLECNCRLGDPETQVILPGLGDDFRLEMLRVARRLGFYQKSHNGEDFCHDGQHRVFVVGAAPEYPLLSPPQRCVVGASARDPHTIPYSIDRNGLSKGGRVVGALGTAKRLEDARTSAYLHLQKFELKDPSSETRVPLHFRNDIAAEFVQP